MSDKADLSAEDTDAIAEAALLVIASAVSERYGQPWLVDALRKLLLGARDEGRQEETIRTLINGWCVLLHSAGYPKDVVAKVLMECGVDHLVGCHGRAETERLLQMAFEMWTARHAPERRH